MREEDLRTDRDALLAALVALEAAAFEDYGMRTDPAPRTAAALCYAREVIRETRGRAGRSAMTTPRVAG